MMMIICEVHHLRQYDRLSNKQLDSHMVIIGFIGMSSSLLSSPPLPLSLSHLSMLAWSRQNLLRQVSYSQIPFLSSTFTGFQARYYFPIARHVLHKIWEINNCNCMTGILIYSHHVMSRYGYTQASLHTLTNYFQFLSSKSTYKAFVTPEL